MSQSGSLTAQLLKAREPVQESRRKTKLKKIIMCSEKTMLYAVLLLASAVLMANCQVGKISSCCTRVSSYKPKVAITDFLIQEESLPCVEAVIFFTQTGKLLCSKPNTPWVAKKIEEILKKKAEKNN